MLCCSCVVSSSWVFFGLGAISSWYSSVALYALLPIATYVLPWVFGCSCEHLLRLQPYFMFRRSLGLGFFLRNSGVVTQFLDRAYLLFVSSFSGEVLIDGTCELRK